MQSLRVSRGIALLFSRTFSTRWGEGQPHAPAAFTPGKDPAPIVQGGWLGPRAGLGICGKSRPHRDSIPDRPARSSVAIPTELPGMYKVNTVIIYFSSVTKATLFLRDVNEFLYAILALFVRF